MDENESNIRFLLSLEESTVKVVHHASSELILEEAEIRYKAITISFVDKRRKECLAVLEDHIVSISPGFVRISDYYNFTPDYQEGT
jgi:hypothetical protein